MTIIIKFLVLLALVVAMIWSLIQIPFWMAIVLCLVIMTCTIGWLISVAPSDKETALIPTGEIKFVVEGDSCLKVLANLKGTGWWYDESTETVVKEELDDNNVSNAVYTPSFFGIYWVSWFYSLRQIHVWIFEWTKLVKGDAQKGEGTYLLEHRKEYVNSLFLFATYPIHAKTVEIAGNLQIDILALVTLRVVHPLIPVFVFKGTYLTLVDAAINGAITDLCRDKTLDTFRAMEKEGPGNPFSETIMRLNDSVTEDSERKTTTEGIPKIWGVAIHKVDFISFDLSVESKEAQVATMALEVARLEASADVQRGEGIKAIGNANAAALGARLASAEKFPGGIQALQEQLKMEGVSGFKGSFLSLGGEQPSPAIVVNPKTT
ncbi:MAG: hypothetical protein WAV98_02260 [Minisyncoccia bacterium]